MPCAAWSARHDVSSVAGASMKKILVVDDNALNRELAQQLLEDHHHVTGAGDGELGVALAVRDVPDLILMDISMPRVDGFEALRRLRSDARTANIPVIALTAHAIRGDRERMLNAGFNGYVSKPFDDDDLLRQIESLLR
jgi:CheY-like chemotaxis protein